MTQAKSIVRVVFIALLIDLFSFTIILPLYPRIIEHYTLSKNNTSLLKNLLAQLNRFKKFITYNNFRALTYNENKKLETTLVGGVVGSVFSLCQFIASPIIGYMSDIFGRRTTLLVTLLGNLISNLVWVFSNNFEIFVLARIIGGLSEGSSQLSTTIIADVTNQQDRSSSLALVGVAFSIAFTLGPLLGAISLSAKVMDFFKALSPINSTTFAPAAFVATILIVLEIIYVYMNLQETLPKKNKIIKKIKKIKNYPKHTKLTNINILYFVYTLIFSGLEFTVPFLAYNKFSYNSKNQGIMFMYIGIVSSILQGGYVRRNKANKEKGLIYTGLLTCIASLSCFGLCDFVPVFCTRFFFYIGITCLSATSAFVVVSLNSHLSLTIDKLGYPYNQRKGSIQGVYRSYGQLGRILGPTTYCSIYWLYGPSACYILGCAFTFGLMVFSSKVLYESSIKTKLK